MIQTYNIEYCAYLCSKKEKVTFVITKDNEMSLFLFCYYQWKYKTTRDFKTIIFKKQKDILYYFLKFISILSFNYYKIHYAYE